VFVTLYVVCIGLDNVGEIGLEVFGMLGFRDRKIEESSDDSDDDDEGDVPTSPTTIRTKHDLMMKTEVCALLLLICSMYEGSHRS